MSRAATGSTRRAARGLVLGMAALVLALPAALAQAAPAAPAAPIAPAAPGIATAPPTTLTGQALGDALRRGGYVLYFRHGRTDFGQSDENMTSFDDCTQQRNLTDEGRRQAGAIGAAIRQQRIPVDAVLASPFCRTRETAMLAFGKATVANEVRGGPAQPDDAHRYDGLRALLARRPPPGANVVIVSHGNPFRAVAEGPYLAEGEAAVIEPRGEAGFRVVGRIPPDAWVSLGAR